jgi:hypothetical protein
LDFGNFTTLIADGTMMEIFCFVWEYGHEKERKMIGGFTDDPMGGIITVKAMFGARQLMLFYSLIAKSKNYKHFLNDYL